MTTCNSALASRRRFLPCCELSRGEEEKRGGDRRQSVGRDGGGFCRRNEEARSPRGKIGTRVKKEGERWLARVLQPHETRTLDRSCGSLPLGDVSAFRLFLRLCTVPS